MPVKHDIRAEDELARVEARAITKAYHPSNGCHNKNRPKVFDVQRLLALEVPESKTMIENLLPSGGACLLVGAAKSGKTLLAVQTAIAVASGNALFEYYRITEPGPALILEQDDTAGAASIKTILQRSPVPVNGIPFYLTPQVPFDFGPQLIEWLEDEIKARSLQLVVLDSYTALRASRKSGIDIVKAEQSDLTLLDALAKRTSSTMLVLHHVSKGSNGMDWSERAAGTFAMAAATEAQIHISRFVDLDEGAPERLVRVRGRHLEGAEMVLRFRKESLDYEHVLNGGAASFYPLILHLRSIIGTQSFGPKEFAHATGLSHATATRQIGRLYRASALTKRGFGEYVLSQ